jgi:uncharacterized pyridoxamine 5'-phosphate oxidase family protein
MSLEVYEFLSAHRPFYLATVDGDAPKLRPMGFLMHHEGKIWLGMGDHKNVYKQILANPKIEVVAVQPEVQWLRVSAKLVFDPRPELVAKALDVMPQLKALYVEGGPRMAVGYLTEGEAQFVDIPTNTPRIVEL